MDAAKYPARGRSFCELDHGQLTEQQGERAVRWSNQYPRRESRFSQQYDTKLKVTDSEIAFQACSLNFVLPEPCLKVDFPQAVAFAEVFEAEGIVSAGA